MSNKDKLNAELFRLEGPFCLFNTAWKVSKYGVISGPYFPVFGLNTEIYFINRNLTQW